MHPRISSGVKRNMLYLNHLESDAMYATSVSKVAVLHYFGIAYTIVLYIVVHLAGNIYLDIPCVYLHSKIRAALKTADKLVS